MKKQKKTTSKVEVVGRAGSKANRKSAGAQQLGRLHSSTDNILALVHVFSYLIGGAFYDQLQARHGLSVQQWRILLTVAQHPGATAVDVIAKWALEPMAVSRAVRELEHRGLIERRVGNSDRRSQELYLTRKGLRTYDQAVPDANKRYHEIVDCLTPKNRALLAQSLGALIANTKRLLD